MTISTITKDHTFVNNTETADATKVNTNYDTVYSATNTIIGAINTASGSKTSLDARLSVTLNADGTAKSGVTAGGEWINPDLSPLYASTTTFTVEDDQTDVYLDTRRLKIVLAAGTSYTEVSSSSYSAGSGLTTVTTEDAILTDPITSVSHSTNSPGSVSSISTDYLPDAETYVNGLITTALSALSLTGMIAPFPIESVPTGWLECDGAAVSRTTYADLFTLIAETYGNGDGSTTFNLPDLRGQFLRGWDNSAGTDPDAASRTDRGDGTTGDHVGTNQADEFEDHTHPQRYRNPGNNVAGGSDNVHLSTTVNTDGDPTGSTGGNETRPTNITVMYCIKT